MQVRVVASVDAQIAEQARYWRGKAGREIAERMVREVKAAINQLASATSGHPIEGLSANFKRLLASKRPPFYLYYYVDEELEDILVFLLRHASQRPLTPEEIVQLANEAKDELLSDEA